MAVKIVVLDDGETWAGSAAVYTVSDEAYEKLCYGDMKVKHLEDHEIITVDVLDTRETE